jgi:hypothetical protein
MIVRKYLGSGISGCVRYVMGEGKRDPATGAVPKLLPGETSRVAWYSGTGFGFPIDSEERLEIARRLMEWAAQTQASKTKKCKDDCLHLVLSWEPGENPTREEMEAAAKSALAFRGMAEARAIFVAHTDTDHVHLHAVISRIDPQTGRAYSDSYDTIEYSTWALQWELAHGGVRCEARLGGFEPSAVREPEAALEAFFARRETFTLFELSRELTKVVPSREARRAFIAEVLTRPDIVRLVDPESRQVMRYTTRQTLHAEHLAEASAARLFADAGHRVPAAVLDRLQIELEKAGMSLRADQLGALQHATRAEGLSVIAGKAGTGKSFSMSVIAAAYAQEGYTVQAIAPTNKVASALRADGLDGRTIHSVLGELDRGNLQWNGKSVIMVDEAGMVSTRLMARILSHAAHAGAKVILVGDDKQLSSIERGGMFGYFAGLHGTHELSQITRQRGAEQRELARRASQYDFAAALAGLEGQGGIVTAATAQDRIGRAADLWRQTTASSPHASIIVVAVSNADVQTANAAIREVRRERGELGRDHQLATADGLQNFAEGDRILFNASAKSREGRKAGLTNGNAGRIVGIEGSRVTVALDGAKDGEVVGFTVGKNHEAGEFDAIRLAYAATIWKAQGATYDHAIVLDSGNLRARTAYVALTRHRETVRVITSPDLQRRGDSWMKHRGGLEALTAKQRTNAEESYRKWRGAHPDRAQRYPLADYVAFVQEREAKRGAETSPAADMAERWSRPDDRRAASRFEAIDYEAPDIGNLEPAAVRAAVGAESMERSDLTRRGPALGRPDAGSGSPASLGMLRTTGMDGLDENSLQDQADEEVRRLRELQQIEERAQAFRQERDIEAQEAKKKRAAYQQEIDARDANEGDISSATARYAIALGENYTIRDPYGSLAKAAMSESAMFHRGQEKLRAAAAEEKDPAKRRVIELRRQIEAHDYMAITSDRLAGISTAIAGHESEQAVADRTRAASYRNLATSLRAERSELIEASQRRQPSVSQGAVVAPPSPEAEPGGPVAATPPTQSAGQGAEEKAAPASSDRLPEAANDRGNPTVEPASREFRRHDTIEPPMDPYVTIERDKEVLPPASVEAPWLNALQQRFGRDPDLAADKEMSDNAVVKLAKRLDAEKGQERSEKGQGRDDPEPGTEPDM